MSKVIKDYVAFVNLQRQSGSNNAAKHLFKQVVSLNGLKRNERDKRQNIVLNGKLYGVSVGLKDECRQFDDDYEGLIHIDPKNSTVEMCQRVDLKENPRHSLIRSNGMKARTVKILSSYPAGFKIWQ